MVKGLWRLLYSCVYPFQSFLDAASTTVCSHVYIFSNVYFFFFTVYKKHYPPALNDEVWRLEKIGKDGSFHKRLTKAGIYTVEDFLRLVVRDSQKLRTVSICKV